MWKVSESGGAISFLLPGVGTDWNQQSTVQINVQYIGLSLSCDLFL